MYETGQHNSSVITVPQYLCNDVLAISLVPIQPKGVLGKRCCTSTLKLVEAS
jgi:hypothetical protein